MFLKDGPTDKSIHSTWIDKLALALAGVGPSDCTYNDTYEGLLPSGAM